MGDDREADGTQGMGVAPANVMAGLARRSSTAGMPKMGSFVQPRNGVAEAMQNMDRGSMSSGSSWMSGQLSRAVLQHSHAGKEAVSFLKMAWYLTLVAIIGLGIAGIVI